ncbi:phage tail tape measure protein [Streptococcus sp. O1]|uniref:phage tail tape measure protein n=1 Tax=Streptococcus sp. O1 TaxID=2928735 RepID=UPI00211B70D3|nr:phage tail tape measure protein [Streptococcus sp. O1]MCQ9215052.1 phage tail tape measure protein [Streptococcus sp. O1]
MAGKNIKGITIEIEGNTQPLQKALKDVDSSASKASREIKDIDKSLKFDTGNVTLLTQKQELLGKQVQTTKEKLEILKGAQSQVEAQFKSGEIGAEQYRAFQREVVQTENVLKGYEKKLENVNQVLENNSNNTRSNQNQLKDLQNEQKQLAIESDKVSSSFKLQEAQLGSSASEADKLALAEKRIAAQSGIVENQIADLEKQLELTKKEYGENSEQANRLEIQLNETKTAYSNLSNEMDHLKSAGSGAKDSLEDTNKLLKAELLNQFADKLSDISQKLVDFGKSALDAFRTVDDGMDTIVTKTGASGEALEEMQGIASDLATSIPTEFSEAGEAVGEVNTQFGLMGDSLKLTAEDMIKFSQINGTDVTTTTIQSKQALEAYGLSVDYLSDVLDSTTYVAQMTGVSVQDLMKKAIDGAPQIKALGLEFDEGVALLGQFEQQGVDSSAALGGLSKAAATYAKNGKTLKEGLAETIEKIKVSTNETEALSTASEIFGSKKALTMVDAIKRGTFSLDVFSGTAENAAGVVSETFDATLDPIDKFQTAQNSATLAMAELGDSIAEALAPILEIVVELLKQVAKWFSGLPGPIKQFIVILGGVVTIVGILTPIFLTLQAAAVATGVSIGGLIAAALPIIGIGVAIVAGITAIILIIKHLWETNEGFRNAVTNVWNAIVVVITSVIQDVSKFVMALWGTLTAWWTENQELIRNSAEKVWKSIQTVIQVVMNVLGPLLQGAWQNIQVVISTVWDLIKNNIQTVMTVVLNIIKAVMQVINGDWSGAWQSIKNIFSTIWNGMKNTLSIILQAISQVISNTWNAVKGTISGVLSSISGVVSSVWNNISGTINGVMNGISGTVSGIWNGIKDTISSAINAAKDAVSGAINAIKGLFNFNISWPHIPLPHFSVKGSANPLDWLKNGVPSIAIDWYAKGGIMTKPTLFGFNGNRAMVGGEAGAEAVLPLNDKTLGAIGRAQAEAAGGTGNTFNFNITVNGNVDDPNEMAEMLYRKVEQLMVRERMA